MRPVLHLVRKEFRQVFRDGATLRLIFIAPLVQLFVFSYAANTDLVDVPISFLDDDRTAETRRLAEALLHSDVFVAGPALQGPGDLDARLEGGGTRLAVRFPRGWTEDLAAGRPATIAVTIDGQNSSVAGRSGGYARTILEREVRRMRAEKGLPPPPGGHVVGVTRFFYNPELESRIYMVPGVIVLLITVISALLTGMAVVREKELGTLEQLLVSPLTPAQIVAGKTIPFAIVSYAELAFAGTIGVLWFRVPLAGSVPLLLACALAYLLVTLGVGLIASTVSQTQQQAMLTVWFFLVFGILMSGFFYPIENMPRWAQWISALDPVRWVMNIVRGIFLKGAGLADLWRDIVVLAAMGVAVFTTAALRFRKRLS